MKTGFLFLLVTLAFTACQKDNDDIAPAKPAEAVAGSYALTSFRYVMGDDQINLPTLPYTQNGQTLSGTVDLTPGSADDQVTLILTLKATGSNDQSIKIDNITVQKNNRDYGLLVNNQRIATTDGRTLIMDVSETDPTTKEKIELKFTAEK